MNTQICPKCKQSFNIVRTFRNSAEELRTACGNCGVFLVPEAEVELTDEQIKRNDQIYQSVYNAIKVITENDDLSYDMGYLGDITDGLIRLILTNDSIPDIAVRYPGVITENEAQHIEELVYAPGHEPGI